MDSLGGFAAGRSDPFNARLICPLNATMLPTERREHGTVEDANDDGRNCSRFLRRLTAGGAFYGSHQQSYRLA